MPATTTTTARHSTLSLSYQDRATLPNTSPLAAYLLRLIAAKKTNLCVSADVTSTSELLRLAEDVGDSICVLKTHADIVQDFSQRTMQSLQSIARRKGFLIFEDRKFGDIGSTVQKQYTGGPLQIVRWANIINAHIFPGPSIITALSSASDDAVTAYTTSVETSISGPPGAEYDTSAEQEEPEDIPEEELVGRDEGDRVSTSSTSSDDVDEDLDNFGEEIGRKLSANSPADRSGRKLSVVSVSTTISTKTESISPQPTSLPPGLPHRISSAPEIDVKAALDRLGEPPMARSLLLLAEMSSQGNLLNAAYTAECLVQARKNSEFVMGFIAQRSLNAQKGDNFITMTPGVQIGASGDGLGQQYNTPEKVIGDAGTDVIIVGRGIYGSADRKVVAEEYRVRAWRAYEERIGRKGR